MITLPFALSAACVDGSEHLEIVLELDVFDVTLCTFVIRGAKCLSATDLSWASCRCLYEDGRFELKMKVDRSLNGRRLTFLYDRAQGVQDLKSDVTISIISCPPEFPNSATRRVSVVSGEDLEIDFPVRTYTTSVSSCRLVKLHSLESPAAREVSVVIICNRSCARRRCCYVCVLGRRDSHHGRCMCQKRPIHCPSKTGIGNLSPKGRDIEMSNLESLYWEIPDDSVAPPSDPDAAPPLPCRRKLIRRLPDDYLTPTVACHLKELTELNLCPPLLSVYRRRASSVPDHLLMPEMKGADQLSKDSVLSTTGIDMLFRRASSVPADPHTHAALLALEEKSGVTSNDNPSNETDFLPFAPRSLPMSLIVETSLIGSLPTPAYTGAEWRRPDTEHVPMFRPAVCRQFRRPLIPSPSQAKITGAAVGNTVIPASLRAAADPAAKTNVFTVTVDIENDYVPHHIIEGLLSPGEPSAAASAKHFQSSPMSLFHETARNPSGKSQSLAAKLESDYVPHHALEELLACGKSSPASDSTQLLQGSSASDCQRHRVPQQATSSLSCKPMSEAKMDTKDTTDGVLHHTSSSRTAANSRQDDDLNVLSATSESDPDAETTPLYVNRAFFPPEQPRAPLDSYSDGEEVELTFVNADLD
ncbi:hypothetical protein BaRGS_00039869 [Batillaria attramentaria]|uniref:Uncharacterized protein n=1 Tax=Batillaria attramentaria TaxID=370345 RepID=A0ABD0J1P9_9CAEN